MEESRDENSGGEDFLEVGPGVVLEEDVVAEEVGEGGLRDAVGDGVGGGEVGIGDGEDSDGISLIKVDGDGGGGEERGK